MQNSISPTRKHSLFTSTISKEEDGVTYLLGEELTDIITKHSFSHLAASLWLGRKLKSRKTASLIDLAFRLLLDHGPYVSGAVNTIVSARAGKDMVSSLTSGLLTIGPRFGGAVNEAANTWYRGVTDRIPAPVLVETYAKKKIFVSGIGHRKYRVDLPDPRTLQIAKLTKKLRKTPHLDYAREVERITTQKNPKLILNVDGALAASLLDHLQQEEGLTGKEIEKLITCEFFNAVFIASRTVGFLAHYLDQRRLDEGLFRLPENEVFTP